MAAVPVLLHEQHWFFPLDDNGQTWGTPIEINSNFVTMDQCSAMIALILRPRSPSITPAAAMRATSYVVYADNNSFDGADIYVQRSTDRGLTFSAPKILNSKPARTARNGSPGLRSIRIRVAFTSSITTKGWQKPAI